MLTEFKKTLWSKALEWQFRQELKLSSHELKRSESITLIFFHGYSLAHTIRPLVIARSLRTRNLPVEFAGLGPYADLIKKEGFAVHEVVTLPQSIMDEHISQGDYQFYDLEWIHRCVESEREIIQRVDPKFIIQDMKPTVDISASMEGKDLGIITAAYNQPNYPFRIQLPNNYSTSIGPLADYKRKHSNLLKTSKIIYLLSDIPEFHPQRVDIPWHYVYVGPLIDDKKSKRSDFKELTENLPWNRKYPLIFVTCGSSGFYPYYLKDFLEGIRDRPYRVIVATAGRWKSENNNKNVFITDFIPLNTVLKDACVVICTGGSGTVYHALKAGIPVIGAPEHLDQEYHLNRIYDLGLGLKIDWSDFCSGGIIKAIDSLFGNYNGFRSRCKEFSRYLTKWRGGEVAAIIIEKCLLGPNQVDSNYAMEETDFVKYLDSMSPKELGVESIQTMLRRNVKEGLPHRRIGRYTIYDQIDSWNWLYKNEPLFFESDYKALEIKRQLFHKIGADSVTSSSNESTYRISCQYTFYAQEAIRQSGEARLFIPYPLETTYQSSIILESCFPEILGKYWCPSLGFFYGVPLSEVQNSRGAGFDVSYVCSLTVKARNEIEGFCEAELAKEEIEMFTAIDGSLKESKIVSDFLSDVFERCDVSSEISIARTIYDLLIVSRSYKMTKDQFQTFEHCAEILLHDDGGHCITFAYAFIALCRLMGIPAREVGGSIIGYPVGQSKFYSSFYCANSLLAHTWVEIFIKGKGWLPIEFHGIVIGNNAITNNNIKDVEIRKKIEKYTGHFHDYYFGHLDTYHLVFSNSTKKIPPLLVKGSQADETIYPRWQMPKNLRYLSELIAELQ